MIEIFKNKNINVIKESVNFNNSNITSATKALQSALRAASSSDDKYQILAYIIAGALLPSFNNKVGDVWNFLKFFATNASKGLSFKKNQDVEQALEKNFKIKK